MSDQAIGFLGRFSSLAPGAPAEAHPQHGHPGEPPLPRAVGHLFSQKGIPPQRQGRQIIGRIDAGEVGGHEALEGVGLAGGKPGKIRAQIRGIGDIRIQQGSDKDDPDGQRDAPRAVSRGIGVAQRVAVNIRIPVQRLRIPGLRHQGIRLQAAAQRGIVEPGPVIIQAQPRLPPLAGEAAVVGGDYFPLTVPLI